MVDEVLLSKIRALHSQEESYEVDESIADHANSLERKTTQIYWKIQNGREDLLKAMRLNSDQKIHAMTSILARYDQAWQKQLFLDDPHYLIFLSAIDTKSSVEVIKCLLNAYREADPSKQLLKSMLNYHPELLQTVIAQGCPETVAVLLQVYQETGSLKKQLFTPQHEVFISAAGACPTIFKAVINAYKEADPSQQQLKAATLANNLKAWSATQDESQNLEAANAIEKKIMLIMLYKEFSQGLLGIWSLFGLNYLLNPIIRDEVSPMLNNRLLFNLRGMGSEASAEPSTSPSLDMNYRVSNFNI